MCNEENLSELSVAEQKTNLRKRAKAMLLETFKDKELKAQIEKTVFKAFTESEIYRKAEWIFGFMAMQDEIDLQKILEKAVADGKRVALPRMVPGTNDMDFYFVEDFKKDFQADNKYNIKEPSIDSEKVDVSLIPENSVFLVPGLAFNLEGSRLGRGKGYYDKYLSAVNFCKNKKICLCGVCSINVITRAIPTEENDVRMTHILNEYGLVQCTERIYKV